jgi:class 3 adenylate cyclase
MAGVIGEKKFAYDIWGDAVNIASRLESSGEVGRVNISKEVYDVVRDRFACEHRGRVAIKNRGEIDMYFVTDRID